jgi:hypothetical protein
MVPPVTTPTTDLGMSFTTTPDGQVVLDYRVGADGDLALVSGTDRLAQDVTKWLYTPPGADPFTPEAGNTLYADVGQPAAPDLSAYAQTIDATLTDFAARQQADLAAGTLVAESVLASWDPPALTRSGSLLSITLRLYAQSGDATTVAATLPAVSNPMP